MCGRYLIDDEVYADLLMMLRESMALTNSTQQSPSTAFASPPSALGAPVKGEVFPTNIAPVITNDGATAVIPADENICRLSGEGMESVFVCGYKWGFPHWKGTGVIINARAETAAEKNMFRKPLLTRRCVIPSSGFFEWSRTSGNKKKDKYLLRRPGEHTLFMAGIANTFRDSSGYDYSAFVILTTAASESVAAIHDRMPVILAPDECDCWISDEGFAEHALRRTGPALTLELQQAT